MISEPFADAAAAPAAAAADPLERLTMQVPSRTTAPIGALLPARVTATGTRRRLLEQALLLFGERGFHAVSMRDLGRTLGLQASALYVHVASKQKLLAELIRIGHEEHRDVLRLSLLEAGAEPEEQLRALVRAHVNFHCAHPLLARVGNRELGSLAEAERDDVLKIRLDTERLFLDVIERGQRLGSFDDGDQVLAVAAIGGMGIRVAEWWQPTLGMTAGHVAETYADFALRLVRSPAA